MLRKKSVIMIALFILLMGVLAGCGLMPKPPQYNVPDELKELQLSHFMSTHKEDFDTVPYHKYEGKITIGFAMDSLKEERWQKDRDYFAAKAKDLGADVRVKEANGDDRLQLSQVEELIAEGVNVLVVVPVSGENAAEIVKKAHQADVKVISYDRLVKNSPVDYYVSFDNEKVGRMQAEAMLRAVPAGDIAYVGGAPTDNNALLFRKGALDALSGQLASGKLQLVMDRYSTDWKPDEAYKNVKELLKQKKNSLRGIIAANDGTASGAIQALKESGLDGKVFVTGQDADLAAVQRIVAGTQMMTVYKSVRVLAETAAETAVQAAEGSEVKTTGTIANGYGQIPSILLEPIEVNKGNIDDTVIADQFHTKEAVYK